MSIKIEKKGTKSLFGELVFLDTETTGLGPDDRLCQCAYIYRGEQYNELFKPPLPISVEAMSISHVTNHHVEDKPTFEGSKIQQHLQAVFADDQTLMVAHNAPFDMAILERDGVTVKRYIDTKKVAQVLDPDGVIPRYSMQYLRYYLDLQVEGAQAHDALGDVLVLHALFERLYAKYVAQGMEHADIVTEMERVSSLPTLIKKFTFGKYKDKLVADVARDDRGYLEWLLGQKQAQRAQGNPDEDWEYTLKTYLE